MATCQDVVGYLESLGNPEVAAHSQRYFKTGKGEYGHGDVFLGIRIPVLRKTVRLYLDLSLAELRKLLQSKCHEARLLSLLILVARYPKADENERGAIYNLYLKNTRYVNNWDLVDSSAPRIAGAWLADKDRAVLYHLANSSNLWERRIAIMATFYFIKNGEFSDTFKLSTILLNDPEDLIHKAVGWMLREVGNRDREAEEQFLKRHYKQMPRTMLRYAIERFGQQRRQDYLQGKV